MALAEDRLSIRLVLDTNLADPAQDPPEMVALRALDVEGWIQLWRTDAMDTELASSADPDKRTRLLGHSAQLPEQLGVMVLGHSRLGSCVAGSDADSAMWDRVWDTIHPGKDRATARENDVKDALHVWTAMRYGSDGFVTMDGSGPGKGLLDRAGAVKVEFDGFNIWSPAQALAYVERRKHRHQFRVAGT